LENVNAWLSKATTQAFQEVDYREWVKLPWAREQLIAKARGKGKGK